MFQIIFNIPRRFSQKAQRQESNLSLFLFLYVKASFIFENQLGIHYSTIHRSHCAAGWIPTTPKAFFQVHRLISNWQCLLGRPWRRNRSFRGSSIGSICYCPRWSFLMSGQAPQAPTLSLNTKSCIFLLYVRQRLPCLPTGWNSSFSIYFCRAQALCKPQLPSISNITNFGPGNTKP